MGVASLKQQVNHVLDRMDKTVKEGPERSRHEAKRLQIAHRGIYSINSRRSVQKRCLAMLRSLPHELKVRRLADLTPAHIAWAVDNMKTNGRAGATIKSHLSAYRKLQQGIIDRGWSKLRPEALVPDHLYDGLVRRDPRGPYSARVADRIIEHLRHHPRWGTEFVQMCRLARAAGLRRAELVGLRQEDIDRAAGTITVRKTSAKGGKERVVALDPAGRAALEAVLDTIPADNPYIWFNGRVIAENLERNIRAFCQAQGITCRGIHGFRATFADEWLNRHLGDGLVSRRQEQAARRELSALMGHVRTQITYSYTPRRS